MLQRPIKWVEDRRENFTATNHERDQDWDVEVASTPMEAARIRGHFRHDHGASTPYGVSLPYNATTNLLGPYVLPALRLDVAVPDEFRRRARRRAAPAGRRARS